MRDEKHDSWSTDDDWEGRGAERLYAYMIWTERVANGLQTSDHEKTESCVEEKFADAFASD